MLRILAFTLGLMTALWTTAAAATPLWEKAQTGMNVNEVLQVFPDAVRRDSNNQESQAEARRLGEERARIPEMRIQDNPYRARFLFREDGLARVVLELIHGEMPFSQGLQLTEKVRDALSEQYGEPVDKNATGDGYRVDWRDGQRRIRLVVISRSYEIKAFEIIYEPIDSTLEPARSSR